MAGSTSAEADPQAKLYEVQARVAEAATPLSQLVAATSIEAACSEALGRWATLTGRPLAVSSTTVQPRYAACEYWGHIFVGKREDMTSWVYDRVAARVVKADVLQGGRWRELDARACANILESLHANGVVDGPVVNTQEWEDVCLVDEIPQWAEHEDMPQPDGRQLAAQLRQAQTSDAAGPRYAVGEHAPLILHGVAQSVSWVYDRQICEIVAAQIETPPRSKRLPRPLNDGERCALLEQLRGNGTINGELLDEGPDTGIELVDALPGWASALTGEKLDAVFQPSPMHIPDEMATFEAFADLDVARAWYPRVPPREWMALRPEDIQGLMILGPTAPTDRPAGNRTVYQPRLDADAWPEGLSAEEAFASLAHAREQCPGVPLGQWAARKENEIDNVMVIHRGSGSPSDGSPRRDRQRS